MGPPVGGGVGVGGLTSGALTGAAASQFLHRPALPIGVHEFVSALAATCPPRFAPRWSASGRRPASSPPPRPRLVCLAVSGGVDSMALAHLCALIQRSGRGGPGGSGGLGLGLAVGGGGGIQLADNPVHGFRAVIVDHALREGSAEEAARVSRVLHDKMGILSTRARVNWRRELGLRVRRAGADGQPVASSSPALEALRDMAGGADAAPAAEFAAALAKVGGGGLEAAARGARYRVLGRHCAQFRAASLLLAHHADDQYETVLMRVASGHARGGARAVAGMKAANDIPECGGLHGVSRSGYVDDSLGWYPMIEARPTRRQRMALIRQWADEWEVQEGGLKGVQQRLRDGRPGDYDSYFESKDLAQVLGMATREAPSPSSLSTPQVDPPWAGTGSTTDGGAVGLGLGLNKAAASALRHPSKHDPGPLRIEDGGVFVYRPLLGFTKDRLIATCEAADVPWFEDETNADPTLTMRNAVRHMWRGHDLPAALQRESVLQFAERCRRRTAAEDAEADRLLARAEIEEFDPNVGTVVARFPDLSTLVRPARRRWRRGMAGAKDAQQRRLDRLRTRAALVARRVLSLVSPEPQPPPLQNVLPLVPRLFPALADDAGSSKVDTATPKAFNLAGVLFTPTWTAGVGARPQVKYQLSRTPYVANRPQPRFDLTFTAWRRMRTRPAAPPEPKTDTTPAFFTPTTPPPTTATAAGPLPAGPDLPAWTRWSRWRLWDGRFWLRFRHCLPTELVVVPLPREFNLRGAFRDALGPEGRAELDHVLRRFAPGKVRNTLPAVFCVDKEVWKAVVHGTKREELVQRLFAKNQEKEQLQGEEAGRQRCRDEDAAADGKAGSGTPEETETDEDDEDDGVKESGINTSTAADEDADGHDMSAEGMDSTVGDAITELSADKTSPSVTADAAAAVTSSPPSKGSAGRDDKAATLTSPAPPPPPPTTTTTTTTTTTAPAPPWVTPLSPSAMQLLALPTLNIQVPGLDGWLQYEARYRRVDQAVLDNSGFADAVEERRLRRLAWERSALRRRMFGRADARRRRVGS